MTKKKEFIFGILFGVLVTWMILHEVAYHRHVMLSWKIEGRQVELDNLQSEITTNLIERCQIHGAALERLTTRFAALTYVLGIEFESSPDGNGEKMSVPKSDIIDIKRLKESEVTD